MVKCARAGGNGHGAQILWSLQADTFEVLCKKLMGCSQHNMTVRQSRLPGVDPNNGTLPGVDPKSGACRGLKSEHWCLPAGKAEHWNLAVG